MDGEGRPILRSKTERTSKRHQRSWITTSLSLYFFFLYAAVIIITLMSFGYFAVTNSSAQSYYNNDTVGYCILYGSFNEQEQTFELGKNQGCLFTLVADGVLILLACLLILLSLIKAVWGKWLSFILIFDILLIVLGILLALSIAVNISAGFATTCDAQRKFENNVTCSSELPNTNVKYSTNLEIAEIAMWLSFGMLLLCCVLELMVSFCACLFAKVKRDTVQDDWYDKKALARGALHTD